jgi:multidrug efflux pump subunit AcrB
MKKPDGIVRRFGARNIAIKVTREQDANVLDMMRRLRAVAADIDADLRPRGLSLTLSTTRRPTSIRRSAWSTTTSSWAAC